jgi:peptide/nickel transport system substrate-binding protein
MLGLMPVIDPRHYSTLKSKEAGTGPFKVAEWVPNDHLTLVKNTDYWDAGKPILDRITFRIYGDVDAMLAAMQGGLLDIAWGFPPRARTQFKSQFIIQPGQEASAFYYLGLNAKFEPFNKREVRQAMAYALDRVTMARSVLYGFSPAIYTPFPPFSPAYFPAYNHRFVFNLAKARQLLAAAGYPHGFAFTVPTANNFPEFGLFAQILQADLAKIGVTLNVKQMDIAALFDVIHSQKYNGLYTLNDSWAAMEPISMLAVDASLNPKINNAGYKDEQYSKLVATTLAEPDPAKRKQMYSQLNDYILDQSFGMPIASTTSRVVMKSSVHGVEFRLNDVMSFANTWIG